MKRASLITLLLLSSLGALNSARAMDYPLPPAGSRLIGQNQTYTIQEGDNKLQTIARRFNTAAQVILETNNTIAPVNPAPGTVITIPSQMLLPDTPREGIVVNLAELRLYYFPPGENIVQVFPLGIGQLGLETPVSTTRVSQKSRTQPGRRRPVSEPVRWRRELNCLLWFPQGQITRWDAMPCVWVLVMGNILSTEPVRQTALACASVPAVCE